MSDVTARNDPSRPPLRADALHDALAGPAGPLSSFHVLPRCASTNAELRSRADALSDLAVLMTDHQTAGTGRLARAWITPDRAALTGSVLLRPVGAEPQVWGWLPLLTGLALTQALQRCTGLEARLKWPNDVLIPDPQHGEAKVAGILCEALTAAEHAPAMILGMGVNVSQRRDELPPPPQGPAGGLPATSLALAGAATVDRDLLLSEMIREVVGVLTQWRASHGDVRANGLADRVRASTLTLGRAVIVHLPDGSSLRGLAAGINDHAELMVRHRDGQTHAVNAGDVVHVRSMG